MVKIMGTSFTTNASGGATWTSPIPLYGIIKAVIVDLGTATAADVKITPASNTGTNFEILNVTSISSDDIYYPRVPADDKTGTNVTYDGTNEIYVEHLIRDRVTVTITNATASSTLSVKILYV